MALPQRFVFAVQCLLSSTERSLSSTRSFAFGCYTSFATKAAQRTPKSSELTLRASFLAETFGTSKKKMESFLTSNARIVAMNRDKFQNCCHILKDYGLTERDILIYPEVYNCSITKIKTRMEELQREGLGISLHLVTISSNKYKNRFAKMIVDSRIGHEYENHEGLLMKLLNCSQQKAKALMKEHQWLRKSKIMTLKTNIETIKDYGVTSKAILERLFVIVISQDILEYQLSTLRKQGVLFSDYPDSYLSILQPQNMKFEKSLARILAERKVLQEATCKNRKEYILHRLSCSNEDLSVMLRQFRLLMSVNAPKLKQNLDFLLHTCQIHPRDIVSNALVLGFGNSTLRQRYEELQALDMAVSPVHLKMSRKKFRDFIDRLSES